MNVSQTMVRRTSAPWALRLDRIVFSAVALFLTFLVMGGVIRYVLGGTPFYFLVYIPKAFIAVIFFSILSVRNPLQRSALIVCTLTTITVAISAAELVSIQEALFAIWVILPFIFGIVIAPYLFAQPERYGRLAVILLVLAAVGMLVNPLFNFPWVGAKANVLGHNIEAARSWTTFWLERYPGFSRSSINAASQLLVLAVLVRWSRISRPTRLLLWALSGAGIYYTTSKGVQGAYLLLSIYFASAYLGGRYRVIRIAWAGISWVFVLALIGVPLSTLLVSYVIDINSVWEGLLYGSFGVRLTHTWPLAFLSLKDPVAWIFGNGVGAIGSAHRFFGEGGVLIADNLFVFLGVSIGIPLACSLLLYVTWRMTRRYLVGDQNAELAFPLLLAILVYGQVSDIIEGTGVLALFLGILVTFAFSRYKRGITLHG